MGSTHVLVVVGEYWCAQCFVCIQTVNDRMTLIERDLQASVRVSLADYCGLAIVEVSRLEEQVYMIQR